MLGDLHRDVDLRFIGGGAEVRREDGLFNGKQVVFLGRLRLENVQGGARHLAGIERGFQILFHNQAATGAVDEAHPILHFLKCRRVDDVARGGRQGRMQGDEISAAQKVVKFHFFDAKINGAFRRQIGIKGDYFHLQSQRPFGDDGADVAAADDAERLRRQFNAHEFVLFPLAGAGGTVGLGNLPGQREHHGDGVFGGGDGVAERRVHHHDALGGGGGHIDVIDADAGAADHLQVFRRRDDLLGHLGGGADGKAVILIDAGDQFVLAHADDLVGDDATGFKNGLGERA